MIPMYEQSDKELISMACDLYANWIETEEITLSAKDAEESNQKHLIKALNVDQMKLVIRLRELASKIVSPPHSNRSRTFLT